LGNVKNWVAQSVGWMATTTSFAADGPGNQTASPPTDARQLRAGSSVVNPVSVPTGLADELKTRRAPGARVTVAPLYVPLKV